MDAGDEMNEKGRLWKGNVGKKEAGERTEGGRRLETNWWKGPTRRRETREGS